MTEVETKTTGLLAGAGVIAAFLSSTCCIVPFAFVSLGIGGAWMSNLTALAPWQPLFLLAATALIGGGFYARARKRKRTFAEGSYCATDRSEQILSIILWFGVTLTLLAAIFPWIVGVFLD